MPVALLNPAAKTVILIARVAVLVTCLGAPAGTAVADPLPRLDAAVRVSAGWGTFEESTWAYPGVDLVGTLRFGAARHGFVDVQAGYTPLDSHTFLADGRIMRLAVAGGARVLTGGALRLGGMFALDKIMFHADPDVLAEHPGVDLLASRGGVVPTLGLEASYDAGTSLAIGVFGRAGLTDLALYREGDVDPQANGEEGRARLILAGIFVEFRVR